MVEVEGEDENAHKKLNSTQKYCIDFRHLGMPDKLQPIAVRIRLVDPSAFH